MVGVAPTSLQWNQSEFLPAASDSLCKSVPSFVKKERNINKYNRKLQICKTTPENQTSPLENKRLMFVCPFVSTTKPPHM